MIKSALVGCLHPLTLVLYGTEFEAQRACFYFVAELVYLTWQRGGCGWFECVNTDCPFLWANLLPFGAS